MRIAVSSMDNSGWEGAVSPHFGRCPYFTLIDVEDGVVEQIEVVANPHFANHQPGQVPQFVHAQGADMIIAGGMGRRAIAMFDQLGIQAYTGPHPVIHEAVEAALGGQIDGAAPCAGHSESGCDGHSDDAHA